MKKLLVFALLLTTKWATAQGIKGTWQTIDDGNNQPKSHVEINEQGGKYYGKVLKLLQKPADTRCEKCPGERKNQLVVGMIVAENLILEDGFLQKGKILDPENGKTYTCKMWLKEGDPNTLVVRGYLFGFYRTQYWHRVN